MFVRRLIVKKKNLLVVFALVMALALVFTGCGGDENNGDPDPEYTVLNVTGIPANITIIGAALFELEVLNATGQNMGSGSFHFYEPDEKYQPDLDKPWKGQGDYSIGLSEVDMTLVDPNDIVGSIQDAIIENHVYLGADFSGLAAIDLTNPQTAALAIGVWVQSNQDKLPILMGLAQGMPKYSFDGNDTVTIPWNNFLAQSKLEALGPILAQIPQGGS